MDPMANFQSAEFSEFSEGGGILDPVYTVPDKFYRGIRGGTSGIEF